MGDKHNNSADNGIYEAGKDICKNNQIELFSAGHVEDNNRTGHYPKRDTRMKDVSENG
ncbi:MAG: hypothetical protein HFI75_05720 [Lachnospiraceae bacterium]|nr:hypothetical protein [Lachnospiraceae bacterium]